MSDIAIHVSGLGKRYRIGAQQRHDTLRDRIADARIFSLFKRRNGNGNGRQEVNGKGQAGEALPLSASRFPLPTSRLPEANMFWALKDVSFDIRRGEVVGIIGRNGAGKSTLLKILSRITEPTEGYADINGRIASLLEVGTGFHPELTGRENIFLNGSILGMKRVEINKKFDEIVAFAEIEKFIDTPVKHYSSGMYVRLAFAVAAHLDPEILLVDEVLAVGDAAFQKKCLGKMGDVAREGRTVLFVSHNLQAISTLTNETIMLAGGHCRCHGPTLSVIDTYLREGRDETLVYSDQPSSSEPKITRVEVHTSEAGNVQINGKPLEVSIEISTPIPIKGASLSFQIMDLLQSPVAHLWTFDSERSMCREPGVFRIVCRIPKVRLYLGRYMLKLHFSEAAGGKKFQTIDEICSFEVAMYGRHREFEWEPATCVYLEECEWAVNKI